MYYNSPVGTLHIQCRSGFLTSLKLCAAHASGEPECETEAQAAAWLDAYFSGVQLPPAPPMQPDGSEFQCRVWNSLLEIAPGTTASYGQIAERLGSSARAVGQAVGANPIAIIIPCHRVVASGGKLGGYAYGAVMKQALLDLETRYMPFAIPEQAEAKLSDAECDTALLPPR